MTMLSPDHQQPPIALTIAGSDSGGGAGLQADLRTFMAFRVHGCCAITCVTAQNTCGVQRVDALPAPALTAQLESVRTDLPVAALKTGMLLNAELIECTVEQLSSWPIWRVIDPVMVSRTGAVLLETPALEAIKQKLLPLADLITPNLHEAALLSGIDLVDADAAEQAASRLAAMGPKAVLIKGGGDPAWGGRDLLWSGEELQWLEGERVNTTHSHGSGCTLAAAITANLAQQVALPDAIERARRYVRSALQQSLAIGQGQGPLCHWVSP